MRLELVPTSIKLQQGALSRVEVLQNRIDGELLVRKTRGKQREIHIEEVDRVEYLGVHFDGFLSERTFPEQADLTKQWFRWGLDVVEPVHVTQEEIIYPYIPGSNLKTHLINGETSAIEPALASVKRAHKAGVILGDRKPKNIIVEDDGRITHIDFDLKLTGKRREELELAQLIYDITCQTTKFDDTMGIIETFARNSPRKNVTRYSWPKVAQFIKRYDQFYTEHPIGIDWRDSDAGLGNNLAVVTSALSSV